MNIPTDSPQYGIEHLHAAQEYYDQVIIVLIFIIIVFSRISMMYRIVWFLMKKFQSDLEGATWKESMRLLFCTGKAY